MVTVEQGFRFSNSCAYSISDILCFCKFWTMSIIRNYFEEIEFTTWHSMSIQTVSMIKAIRTTHMRSVKKRSILSIIYVFYSFLNKSFASSALLATRPEYHFLRQIQVLWTSNPFSFTARYPVSQQLKARETNATCWSSVAFGKSFWTTLTVLLSLSSNLLVASALEICSPG